MENRRNFIKILSLGSVSATLPCQLLARDAALLKKNYVKFGICTDVHKDVMHDADTRLKAFIDEASGKNLDFIIQLGDFCRPYDYNQDFLAIWNKYQGDKYHVLGNHDTDGGFTQEQVVQYWNAKARYYSYDCKGFHFVVLDGNEKDSSPNRPAGYARYIGEEQLKWLENDLNNTNLPTILFCHQGLDNDNGGIYNGTQCRLVLEQANTKAGFTKVQAVFSGHHHLDYYNKINDIHYIQINSMSYQWLGDQYKYSRYGSEVDKSHPMIKYTVPYKDPIWAYVEISSDNTLSIYGKKTEFVGPSPTELGLTTKFDYPITPQISDRKISLKRR
ncbi:metallophosphoesterase [Arcicella aquatica]|uniref:Metallophosphoesterase n=1 Tax=Arcicella aquatica TaxID=217141 RepID=A0ABU5QMS1_9BACT|nr:metallophosphoesterase [Arcicella aquatica]MEA5258357.1 metallophosphoesterase [Arcicella aquatica]